MTWSRLSAPPVDRPQSAGYRLSSRAQLFAANLLFVLALFPYFKVIPNLTAEVQPIGGVIGIAIWALNRRWHVWESAASPLEHAAPPLEHATSPLVRAASPLVRAASALVRVASALVHAASPLERAASPLVLVLALYSAIYILELAAGSTRASFSEAIEALSILILPLGLALGLETILNQVSARVMTVCAVISALLGTLQFFAPEILNITRVSAVLARAIPRLASVSQGVGGRGVTMLAPEPSYAAPTILLVLVASLWLYARGRITRRRMGFLLVLVGWMVALNQSISLVISVLLFMVILFLGVILHRGSVRHRMLLLVTAAGLLVLTIWGLASFRGSDIRPLRVTGQISALLISRKANVDSLVALSDLNGSGRLSSVVQGYAGTIANHGAGLGIASWNRWITYTGPNTHVLNGHPKPFAYGAFVAMALGVPGLAALAFGLFYLVLKSARERPTALVLATVATGLIGILVNSPVSLPAYWVMMMFALPQDRRSRSSARMLPPPITDAEGQN